MFHRNRCRVCATESSINTYIKSRATKYEMQLKFDAKSYLPAMDQQHCNWNPYRLCFRLRLLGLERRPPVPTPQCHVVLCICSLIHYMLHLVSRTVDWVIQMILSCLTWWSALFLLHYMTAFSFSFFVTFCHSFLFLVDALHGFNCS